MIICLFFCAGAALVAALAARLTTAVALAAALLTALSVLAAAGWRLTEWPIALGSIRSRLVVSCAIAMIAGGLFAGSAWQARGLPPDVEGRAVRVGGTVTAVSENGAIEVRAPIAVAAGSAFRTLQFFRGRGWPEVIPGDGIVVSGALTLPRPPGNPGGFDAAVYARATGISGSIDADSMTIVRPASVWRRFAALPARAGERAAAVLSRLFPEPDASLLYGLIFGGDSNRLPAQTAADFRRAGVLHLLAASGSNIAFILGASVWLLRRFFQRRTALFAGLAIVVIYWLMTGGGASIGRAALMAVIVIAGQLARRRPDSHTSLAVAAAALTLANPLTALDAGFQLSFGATWGLLSLSPKIRATMRARGTPDWLAAPLAVTLGAQAGVLPVSMNLFGEQSLVSPVTNLVALPLAGGAVVTGSLCCLLGGVWLPLAVPAAAITSVLLKLLTVSVVIGARVPFATAALPAMPLCWATAYYACAALAGARRGIRRVAAVLALTVLAMVLRPANSGPGTGLRITFIDVRQGDSALIELPDGRRMLVDCGDMAAAGPAGTANAYGPGGKYDAAGRAIVPYLRRSNIRRLDAVIITHDHADHSGGLAGVRRAVRTGAVLTGSDLTAGQSYTIGGVAIDVLWPPPGQPPMGNDGSLVMRLTYGGRSVLLTGDIEAAAEGSLIAGEARLSADLLKVAHHGGATSSSEPFIAAVGPEAAVISVGAGNSFGHPSLEALARLAGSGTQVLRTDRLGAVRISIDGRKMRIWHWDGRAWRSIALTGTGPDTAKPTSHGLYCSH